MVVGQARDGAIQAVAQVEGGVVEALLGGLVIEVEGVAGDVAFEAVEAVAVEIDAETTVARTGTVQGTGAAWLTAAGAAGREWEQLQDLGDAYLLTQGREVDGRVRCRALRRL